MARLRMGSRGSQLALWQANHISALLREHGHDVDIEVIKTTGDNITDVPLGQVGTKGMFTKEIEEALAEERIDLAVHSLKDLPPSFPRASKSPPIPRARTRGMCFARSVTRASVNCPTERASAPAACAGWRN